MELRAGEGGALGGGLRRCRHPSAWHICGNPRMPCVKGCHANGGSLVSNTRRAGSGI